MKTYSVTVGEVKGFPGGVGNEEWFATHVEAENAIEALGNAYFKAQADADENLQPWQKDALRAHALPEGLRGGPHPADEHETRAILNDPEAMAGLAEAMGEEGPCGICGCLWDHPVHDDSTSGAGPYEIDGVLYALHVWSTVGPKGLYRTRVRLGENLGWAREASTLALPGERMLSILWDDGTRGMLFPHNVEVIEP